VDPTGHQAEEAHTTVDAEILQAWEEYAKQHPVPHHDSSGPGGESTEAGVVTEEEGTPGFADRLLGWAGKPFEWAGEKVRQGRDEVEAWLKKKWGTDEPPSVEKLQNAQALEGLSGLSEEDRQLLAKDLRPIQEGLAEHAGYATELAITEGAPAVAGVVGKAGGKILRSTKKRMTVGRSGHHVPAVRKSMGRPFHVGRGDKSRPTIFSRASDPGADHWRMHNAERAHVGKRQGAFPGGDEQLFDAYRKAYQDLGDIRVDVRSPDGKVVLATDVTPREAVDLIENWLKKER